MRALLLTAALAAAAATPVHDARVKASMAAVVAPASDLLFAVGGEADPDNGPSAAAVAPARWAAAAEAADRLHGAAALLLQPDVAPEGSWRADAQAMADLSAKASAAAKAKDGKTLTQAANDLGDACTSCHARYKAQS